jgi:hypothetical protein
VGSFTGDSKTKGSGTCSLLTLSFSCATFALAGLGATCFSADAFYKTKRDVSGYGSLNRTDSLGSQSRIESASMAFVFGTNII